MLVFLVYSSLHSTIFRIIISFLLKHSLSYVINQQENQIMRIVLPVKCLLCVCVYETNTRKWINIIPKRNKNFFLYSLRVLVTNVCNNNYNNNKKVNIGLEIEEKAKKKLFVLLIINFFVFSCLLNVHKITGCCARWWERISGIESHFERFRTIP